MVVFSQMLRHVALPEQESQRAVTETSYRRTRRPVNQVHVRVRVLV